MNRSTFRIAAVGAIMTLAAVACGTAGTDGATKTGSPAPGTTASRPAGNGVAEMSPGQATRAALAAFTAAPSVHVRGTFTAEGRSERFDMRFEGTSASGSFTMKGAPIQTITSEGSMYLKAAADGLTAMGNPPDVAGMMADRWFKVSPSSEPGISPLSLTFFTSELAAHATTAQGTVTDGALAGQQVVIVAYPDGSKLYVAITGPAYPLRFAVTGGTGGWRDFSDYGTAFHIVAPKNATDIG